MDDIRLAFLLFILAFILPLAALFLAIWANQRAKRLEEQLHLLQKKLNRVLREKSEEEVVSPKEKTELTPSPQQQEEPVVQAFKELRSSSPASFEEYPGPPPLQSTFKPPSGSRSERKGSSRKRLQPSSSLLGREFLTGARLLGWAGGLIFLFGILYFLRYAIDRDWITPLGRILLSGSFGLALVFGATTRYLRRIPLMGNLISGLGFAILYGCIFFSFKVYHLVGMGPSFLGSIALTGGALFFALRWKAEGIAVLALVGGFLSPVFLSEGGGNLYSLSSYMAALDLAFLFLSLKRPWRVVGPLSFLGTSLLAYLWYQNSFDSALLTPSLGFLGLFWILFHVSNTSQIIRYGSGGRFENHFIYIALSFGVWVALSELCVGHPLIFGWFCFGISMVQLGSLLVMKNLGLKEPLALDLLAAHALSFLFLGVGSLLQESYEVMAWGLLSLSLGIMLCRRPSISILGFQLLAFILGAKSIMELHRFGADDLIYHVWLWKAYGLVAFQVIVGWLEQKRLRSGGLQRKEHLILWWGAFLGVTLAFVAAISFWSLHSQALLGTDWESWIQAWELGGFSLISALFLLLGWKIQLNPFLLVLGLFLAGWVVMSGGILLLESSVFLSPKSSYPFWNPNFFSWFSFSLVALATGRKILQVDWKRSKQWALALGRVLGVLSFLLAIHIPSLELDRSGLHLALLAGIRAFYFSALALGVIVVRKGDERMDWIGILVLILGFFYSLQACFFPIGRQGESFLFLNLPFLFSLGGLGCMFLVQRRLRLAHSPLFPGFALLLAAFPLGLLTKEAVGWAVSSKLVLPIFGEVGEQFGLGLASAFWAVQGLTFLVLGLKGEVKIYRLIGMATFALVVLKVFLFDTSNLKPVFRILSFVGSGTLLLLGSLAYNRMLKKEKTS